MIAIEDARDDAGTVGGRRQQDLRCAVLAFDQVMHRAVLEGNALHAAARRFHRLLHRHRHLAGLALAHADATIAVANDGERGEAERTTTLHDLGDAIDRDHLFLQAVVVAFGLRAGLKFSHCLDPLCVRTAGRLHGPPRQAP